MSLFFTNYLWGLRSMDLTHYSIIFVPNPPPPTYSVATRILPTITWNGWNPSETSLFWGGITIGRLLAIPLAVRFSPNLLMRINLVGGLFSSAWLWLIGRVSECIEAAPRDFHLLTKGWPYLGVLTFVERVRECGREEGVIAQPFAVI